MTKLKTNYGFVAGSYGYVVDRYLEHYVFSMHLWFRAGLRREQKVCGEYLFFDNLAESVEQSDKKGNIFNFFLLIIYELYKVLLELCFLFIFCFIYKEIIYLLVDLVLIIFVSMYRQII